MEGDKDIEVSAIKSEASQVITALMGENQRIKAMLAAQLTSNMGLGVRQMQMAGKPQRM